MLSVGTLCSRACPSWILNDHLEDQLDGFRRDQDEGLLPSRPDPPSNHPSELIEKPETRARMSTFQCDELLTQSEILEGDFAVRERAYQHSEEEPDEAKHDQNS